MADDPSDASEIRETDIVFDCPHCGKSLAIDYRGAGLTIPCTDCGKSVEVPIPDGMELVDIDSSDEEQEIRILNLRKSLSAAETRIADLESEVEALTARRDLLEKARTDNMFRLGTVNDRVATIQRAMEEISKALKDITDVARKRP